MTWLRRLLAKSHRSIRFAMVGTAGFGVDAAVLFTLLEIFSVDLAAARVLAFLCAASSNWYLNRHFTFAEQIRAKGMSLEWARFVASAIVSAVPNLGLFFLVMRLLPETPAAILVAMCCGILAGYYCNYQLARLWVFRLDAG